VKIITKMRNKNSGVMLGIDDKNLGFETNRKENVMKKGGFLNRLLSSSAKGCLLASVLTFNCVLGDVFQLQQAGPGGAPVPITVANAVDFVAFITANPNALILLLQWPILHDNGKC
jgi:hypothetical protein